MKTKQEIKTKIRELLHERSNPSVYKLKENRNWVRALCWALGYKTDYMGGGEIKSYFQRNEALINLRKHFDNEREVGDE